MPELKLQGRIALVTGASKGLGKAMAIALAEAGAHLALASRDTEKLEEVAAEIRQRGGTAQVFTADVSDEASVAKLERDVTEKLGKVQILINNAGVNVRKSITDFTLQDWNFVI